MGCGSRLLIGFFQRWTVEEHIRLKNKEKKRSEAHCYANGFNSFQWSETPALLLLTPPPTTTTTGSGRQSVAAAPPLAEVPQDQDLNLPLLHRVLKAPSAALPIPHPLSPGQGSPASTFLFYSLKFFSKCFLPGVLMLSCKPHIWNQC